MENNDRQKGRSHNERFCEIAGVFPLKRHHELATASPAATSVIPATSQSRVGVGRYVFGEVHRKFAAKKNKTMKKKSKKTLF